MKTKATKSSEKIDEAKCRAKLREKGFTEEEASQVVDELNLLLSKGKFDQSPAVVCWNKDRFDLGSELPQMEVVCKSVAKVLQKVRPSISWA